VALADPVIAKLWAWAIVLLDPHWWRSPWQDRGPFRLGVEQAMQVRLGMHRTGLCQTCWMRESEPDIAFCDGRGCRSFEDFLDFLVL
jgi:hypothetical protein